VGRTSTTTSDTNRGNRLEVRVLVQNLQKWPHLASDLVFEDEYNRRHKVDLLLAQEINLPSEVEDFERKQAQVASATSKRFGYGTAIVAVNSDEANAVKEGVKDETPIVSITLSDVRQIESPHAENWIFIRKKTVVATANILAQQRRLGGGSTDAGDSGDGRSDNILQQQRKVRLVSFHGYNGQPFKNVSYLVDHVRAVLDVLLQQESDSDEDTDRYDDNCNIIFAGDFNTWTQEHLDAVEALLEEAGFRRVLSWPYPGRDFPLDHVFFKSNDSMTLKDSTIIESKSDHRGALLKISFD